MTRKRIGVIGFDGITPSDLVNTSETLLTAEVGHDTGMSQKGYEVIVIGLTPRLFATETGMLIKPHTTLADAPELDTIILSGGAGLRRPEINRVVAQWITSRAPSTRRIVSICTGIYGLAPTGLLDGRAVATHWRFTRDIASRFPKLRIVRNAGFTKDGPFYTSSGSTASIQLMLALIEEDYGDRVAMWVAHDLMIFRTRPGTDSGYLDASEFQPDAIDRLRNLPAWILANLHENLSIDVLAAQVCLCPRHFMRLFKKTFGCSATDFVENMRLGEGRRRLSASVASVEIVARSVGYHSADAFRRAFERRAGVSFTKWRNRVREGRADKPLVATP